MIFESESVQTYSTAAFRPSTEIFRLILCELDTCDHTRDHLLHNKFWSGQATVSRDLQGVRQQTLSFKSYISELYIISATTKQFVVIKYKS